MTSSNFGSVVLVAEETRVRTEWSIFCLQTTFAVLPEWLTHLLQMA